MTTPNKEVLVNKSYSSISNSMKDLDLSERLLIISNLLFDCYSLARKADIIYNDLDVEILSTLESYSLLKEFYDFKQESFVFVTLDKAHDLLLLNIKIKRLMLNIKEE